MLSIKRSFTLIEMVLVLAIALILLTLVLPPLTSMWRRSQIENANQRVKNLLLLAHSRSSEYEYSSYGVFFYVDQESGRQRAAFIRDHSIPFYSDEKYPDICDRYIVDSATQIADFDTAFRVAPFEALIWDRATTINNDYRVGQHRNFFGVIYQRGERTTAPFIIYDKDANNDGFGDTLGLEVGTAAGPFGGVLRYTVLNADQDCAIFKPTWGFVIYDEQEFKSFPPDRLDQIFHLNYYSTPLGKIVALDN